MLKQVFIPLALVSALMTQLFVWSFLAGNFFFAGLFGILLFNNVRSAYKIEKAARENGLI